MQVKLIYIAALLLAIALPFLSLGQWQTGHGHAKSLPPDVTEAIAAPDDKLLEKVLAQNLWDQQRGSITPTGTASLVASTVADSTWVLLAVTRAVGDDGMNNGMAIVRHGSEILRIQQGDLLPDGAVMSRVLHNGIEYKSNDKLVQLYLFGKNNSQQKSDDK